MSFLALPDEMIQMIIRELTDLNEMINCRLINKRCKVVVEGMRFSSLAIQFSQPNRYSEILQSNSQRYLFINELIGSTSVLLKAANLNFFGFNFMKKMLSGLRKLWIEQVSIEDDDDFDQFQSNINDLNKLEQLQIGLLSLDTPRYLLLERVRTLAILHSYDGRLSLIAPALTKLATVQSRYNWTFGLTNQTALTHLAISGHEAGLLPGFFYETLQYLRFHTNPNDLELVHNIILSYPALRELHLRLMTKGAVCEMLKQKRICQNSRLAIYFDGLRIDQLQDVEQLFGDENELQPIQLPYIIENWHRFSSPANCVKRVNYTELLRHRDLLSVDEFFSKFIGIKCVEVSLKVHSEAKFIEFLKLCAVLNTLIINGSPLVDWFYNRLHSYCPNLKVLQTTAGSQVQLDFLFDLESLEEFTINREIDSENFKTITRLLERRSSFTLVFRLQDKQVRLVQQHKVWCYLELADHSIRIEHNPRDLTIAKAMEDLTSLVLAKEASEKKKSWKKRKLN